MSHTPHTLAEEFPGQMDAVHALKVSNHHFARLLEQYDEVNDKIHRAETRIEPVSEDVEHMLRRQRLSVKDQIALMLSQAAKG
jgi:uncharacterized protein YdcH (DUF465 family)